MGHCLNRLDEPVFIAVSKPMLTEFGIHYRLERCGHQSRFESHTQKNHDDKGFLFSVAKAVLKVDFNKR